MNRPILITFANVLLMAACGQSTTESHTEEIINPQRGSGLIGYGYDTHTEEFTSQCITSMAATPAPRYRYGGAPTATVSFERGLSYNELKAMMGAQVAGKMNIDGLNVSGAAKFLAEAATTDLSTSLSFVNQIRGVHVSLSEPDLTPKAMEVAETNDSELIRSQCGDSYVDQIELGSQLFVNMRFDFSNKDIKTEFEAEIKLDLVGLFEIEGAVRTALEKYKNNVGVTISAFQVGGNPANLTRIFTSNGTTSDAVMRCSIDNMNKCVEAMQNVVTYASSSADGNYPSQLKDMKFDETIPTGPAYLAYNVKSYYNGGFRRLFPEPSPVLAAEIVNARDRLALAYDLHSSHLRRVLSLKRMRLNDKQRKQIEIIEKTISRFNIPQIVRTAQTCYDTPLRCVKAQEEMTLRSYNPDHLHKEMGFFDYCTVARRGSEAETTVIALRSFLRASENVTCDELESELLNELEIDLHGKGIRDLRPLSDLKGLRILRLDDNQIRNINALTSLQNLQILSVRNNHISNLAGLESLSELLQLDAAYNRIVDIEPLRNLTKLRVLKLQGNLFTNSEPVMSHNYETLFLSLDHICEQERQWAFAEGFIDQRGLDMYRKVNFAPIYNRDGDRSSGIVSFVLCKAAASFY